MKDIPSTLVRLSLFALICSLAAGVAGAQECTEATPIADCVDAAVANAPIPVALPVNCADPFTCDLSIDSWSLPGTLTSADLSLGAPFAGDPLFFFDAGQNRYCTKLYARFRNMGGGAARGCDPGCDVTVDFAYKDTANAIDWNNGAIPWQAIGTYRMVVPAPPGVLWPGATHTQQVGVCWHQPAAGALPETFILRAQLAWPAGPDSNPDNNTAYTFYDRSSYERTAQIALALDLSGSMLTPMAAGTRLSEAKDKAMMFALLVEVGNQLGVYGFATGNPDNEVPAEMVNYTGTDNLAHAATLNDVSEIAAMTAINAPGDVLAAFNGITAQGAHGCTPIGQGLLRARAGLAELAPPAADSGKAIVIFSDGFQNVPPAVNTPLAFSCGFAPAGVPISSADTFDAENIEIYSVFFGPEAGWAYDLMDQIRKQTGTGYVYGASTGLQLAAAYYAIRGLVDDMVFYAEEAQTSLQGPWPEFEMRFDAAATQATVAVAWSRGDGKTRLAVDYRQQGEADWQTSEGRLPTLPGVTDATIPETSHHVFRFAPGPGTTWELRVRQLSPRSGSTSFNVAVFTPVRDAQIQPSLDDEDFTAGDPLPIFARLRTAGQPLTGATVEAVVTAPARPFSTTLRRYADRLTAGVVDPDSNRIPAIATQLGNLLAADTGSAELYPTRLVTVALRDDGGGVDRRANDGLYSGVLAGGETEVAGPYDVAITARATLASGRTVERTALVSTLAGVGPADPGKSEVKIAVSAPRDDGTRLATVTILPTDRFGNAAFPGSAYKVAVSAPGTTLQGGVADPLDTTFTQTLVLPPGMTRPDVSVSFDGVDLETPAGQVAFARHEASFHLGVAIPHGALSNVVSSGPAVGIDYAYRFDPSLALRADLVWNDFDANPGGSLGLVNLNFYLQYRWTGGTWVPYFEAGPGYYDLETAGSAGGFGAGAGARYPLAPRWSLDLNLHGHRVGGSLDLGFTQLRVGAIYNFQ